MCLRVERAWTKRGAGTQGEWKAIANAAQNKCAMTDKTVGSLVFCVVQSNPFQNFEKTHFLLKKVF